MNYFLFVYLFHLLVVAPMLFVAGEYHNHPSIKDNKSFWNLFTMMAFITFIYHGYKIYLYLTL